MDRAPANAYSYQQAQHPQLEENEICRSYDYYVRSALADAMARGLIAGQGTGGVDADVSLTGSTLCLYHAAQCSDTGLPSVRLPDLPGGGIPKWLHRSTCPPRFIDLFSRWAGVVDQIQALSRSQQGELEQIICNPSTLPASYSYAPYSNISPIHNIASYLRAITTDIIRCRPDTSQNPVINAPSIVTTSMWPEPNPPVAMPLTPHEASYLAPNGAPSPMHRRAPSPWLSPRPSSRSSPRLSPRSSPRGGPTLGSSTSLRSPSPNLGWSAAASSGSRNEQGEFIGGFVERRRSTGPSPASSNPYLPLSSGAPPSMPEPQPVQHLFRNKTVGHASSGMYDFDDPTGSTTQIAAVISSNMSISDIITNLGQHGCHDISRRLDLSSCSSRPISRGGFSDIYFGRLDDGTPVALKTIFICGDDEEQERKHLKRTARELHTWSKCKHPNVANLLGLAEFHDQIAMVSTWMENGDLRTYLKKYPNADCFSLCAQVAEGLAYLHSIGIIHGDLKGPNVLISRDGTATLIDFGNAVLGESTLQFTQTATKGALTARWAAPEIFNGEKHNAAADIYALGMTILEAFTGRVPYAGKTDPAVMSTVLNDKRVPDRPQEIPEYTAWGDELWGLLLNCWCHIPSGRPTARDVYQHLQKLRSIPKEPYAPDASWYGQ